MCCPDSLADVLAEFIPDAGVVREILEQVNPRTDKICTVETEQVAAHVSPQKFFLLLVSAERLWIPLPPGKTYIGRHSNCDLVLNYPYVSRYHAMVYRSDGDHIVLIDLGSRHGTFVNDLPIQADVLKQGDSFRIGISTILLAAA